MEDGSVDWMWGKQSWHLVGTEGQVLFYTFHLLHLSLVKSSYASCKVEDNRAPEGREKCVLNTPLLGYVDRW